MNTVELIQYSLDIAFDILGQVTADLTQEQADWKPPGVASTIGAIYSHIITYVDYFVQNYCIEGKPAPESVESRPDVLKMQDVQVDLSELHELAGNVKNKTQDLYHLAHQRALRRDLGAEGLPGSQGLSMVVVAI